MFTLTVVGRVLRLRQNTYWQYYASFDSLLSRAGLGYLGKGCIVRDTTSGLTGSSTRAGTGCADLQLIRNYMWPTAKH